MKLVTAALFIPLLLVAGCAEGDSDSTAAPVRGRVETTGSELFEERVIGVNPGCVTCHSLDEGITLVGPSLFGVESPVADMSTEEYVRQSIVEPDAYVVEGFVPGQMSSNWHEYLTPAQIDSLVEFLTSIR